HSVRPLQGGAVRGRQPGRRRGCRRARHPGDALQAADDDGLRAIMATAGTLFLQYYLFIDPDLAFGSAQSIQAILPAVIGGVATIWGPLIGAVVLGPLSDVTATLLREPPAFLDFLAGRGGLDVVLYGILLIVIILVLPKGIYGAIRERWIRR